MIKLTQLFLFTVILSFLATGAQAASTSSYRGGASSSELTFGAGLSSITPIPGGGASLSGLVGFTHLDSVQVLLSMPGVRGTFQFGIAGLYKRVVLGDSSSGLHVGGGIGLGTTGSFAMGVLALGGIHHNLSTHIALSFDGGATLGVASSAPTAAAIAAGATTSTQADFSLGSYSSILGASIHYLF